MITLLTGLPGNGKTLYALSFVKEWAERENRPVFYSGISGLTLDWTEIDPEKWFECPTGSIVIIDECQRVFRPRSLGRDVPEYVSKLETHRHQGIDLVFITQHPLLADSQIRRLVGCHKHLIRVFGTQAATIHEWASCKDTCDKTSGRSDSIKTRWKYDKKVYEYYKSAELHTVKKNIPLRVYFLFLTPFIIAAAVWYMYTFTKEKSEPLKVQTQSLTSSNNTNNFSNVEHASYKNAKEDARQYVYQETPRVHGLPHTAPKYDHLTKPTIVPVVSMCIDQYRECKCYSQQYTPIAMPREMCRDIMKNGIFRDFDPNPERTKEMQNLLNGQKQGISISPPTS